MSDSTLQGFYCSEKFTWLSVDLEKRQSFSCCAVPPEQIDLNWIKHNPGQLFNTPHLVQERQTMLDGKPVTSCNIPCWQPESQKLVSRRMVFTTQEKKFDSAHAPPPENLNIVLGSTCNMTCSYCCKHNSSAWGRDLEENGSYGNHNRFRLFPIDKALTKVSQAEHRTSAGYLALVEELEQLNTSDCVYITGGETFLYNNLSELVNRVSAHTRVKIYTGMGVNPVRFQSQLAKLSYRDRVTVVVSAENCDDFYEFNRFGNTWQNFETNLAEIQSQNFDWYFSSVLSNLTVFGFVDFATKFKGRYIKYEFCNEPEFLNINVLDDTSKHAVISQLENSDIDFKHALIKAIAIPCTPQQRSQAAVYIKEFARRRSLNIDIFPSSFVQWIQNAQGY